MYARGEQVPGFAPNVAAGGGAPADPMVRATQNKLIRLGYLRGGADGYIGEKTRSAIAAFEQGSGLPADGSPSPQLLARLQATPSGASSATASSAAPSSSAWVAPAGTRSAAPAAAPAAADWVAPAGTPAATPAAATTTSGWVAPAKTQ
jgi:peptidoglycan hydrolase-like protein with peptidoglycan-binding domain